MIPMLVLWLLFGTYEYGRVNPLTPEQIQAMQQEKKQNCEQGKYENTLERIQNCKQ